MKPVTIRDLAEKLKVTHSTVSRALSPGPGRARVSDETRDRIIGLARELGYRPNAMARTLVSRRTYSIGVIVRHLNDPFASYLIQEIHDHLARRGYLGMFFSARTPEEFSQALDSSISRRVDGLISVMLRPEEKAQVERVGAPIVYYGESDKSAHSVGAEPLRGITKAAGHLADLGHRKIGFIGRTESHNLRFSGLRRFVRERGLPWKTGWFRGVDGPRLSQSVDYAFEEGYRQMLALLALTDRPTATICHNDVMAIGALRALRESGRSVPGEMALIGFDNLKEAEYAAVPLTTVDPHLDRIARSLADVIIGLVESEDVPPAVRISVEPSLVVRESTVGSDWKGRTA